MFSKGDLACCEVFVTGKGDSFELILFTAEYSSAAMIWQIFVIGVRVRKNMNVSCLLSNTNYNKVD